MNNPFKQTRVSTALLTALAAVAFVSGCGPKATPSSTPSAGGGAAPSGPALQIAVIPKGTSHEYWKSIHAGAMKAQQDLAKQGVNVQILWKGPASEGDRNGQIDIVQTFITQQVSGIVLAPLDETALASPVHDAVQQKIPVVIIDSALNGNDWSSFVATDNEKGGELGGQEMLKVLNGKKRVLMLRYQLGSNSTEEREKGFLEAIAKDPTIQIVSDDQFAGPTTDTAEKAAENVLARYGTQVDGIFTPNESSTRGMLLAMKSAGIAGKVKFVGFDATPDLVAAMQAGDIDGIVTQNPFKMGDLGVETLVAKIQGKPVEQRIDTGVSLVTKDNLNDPDIKTLINPPLDQYLK